MKNLFFILLASCFFSCKQQTNNIYGVILGKNSAIILVDSNNIFINEDKVLYTFTKKHFLPINAEFHLSSANSNSFNMPQREKFIIGILTEYAKNYQILDWTIIQGPSNQDKIDGMWIYVDSLETKVNTTITSTKVSKDTTIIMPSGGSFCRTLGMTEEEAFIFANKFNYPNWYDNSGKYVVIVQEGERFSYGIQPDYINHLEPKK